MNNKLVGASFLDSSFQDLYESEKAIQGIDIKRRIYENNKRFLFKR